MSRRQLLAFGATGAAAAAAGAGWAWWRLRVSDVPPPDESFWSLRFERPEGGELVLSALRGKPLVVNFWATWCPPCIKELPEFDRLHRAQAGRIQVIGLAIDSAAPVRQFLAKQPVGFPVGLAGFEGTELSRTLGNTSGALPFTAVLDRAGQVRQVKLGQTDFDELSRWVAGL